MYLFGFGDSCCGILIKWKMVKRITIYHGSEKNIEWPVFGKGKKISSHYCPNQHFSGSDSGHVRLAVANGLIFASHKLLEIGRRPFSRNVSRYSFWFLEYSSA